MNSFLLRLPLVVLAVAVMVTPPDVRAADRTAEPQIPYAESPPRPQQVLPADIPKPPPASPPAATPPSVTLAKPKKEESLPDVGRLHSEVSRLTRNKQAVPQLKAVPLRSTMIDPGGVSPSVETIVTFTNSLGMKFAKAGAVEFCLWHTRVKDFEVFATETKLQSEAWRKPGFKQSGDHPVINVSWDEAVAFCEWLTETEHASGVLPVNKSYRLPTDLEWSKAVGLPAEGGTTPEARDMDVPDVYPWGNVWPPPPGSGNFTGEETRSDVAIKGYNDGYPWTSPVGSFRPNALGLYDMGGNAWQWCIDTWNV